MMAYIDTKYIGKCETCRHHRSGTCNQFCDCGEGYSPDLSKIPTADVVQKSEYDRLEKLFNDMTQEAKGYLNRIYGIRADVASEIFANIAREVYSKIPDKILPVTFGEMRRHLDYNDGLNFGSRNAYFDTLKIIAELKKKYTEGASE